jgi:hypothetical protein
MPRLFNLLVAVLLVLAPMAGCGPSLSERELGDVEYGTPNFPAQENAQETPKDAASPAAGQSKEQASPEQPAPEQPASEPATESPK